MKKNNKDSKLDKIFLKEETGGVIRGKILLGEYPDQFPSLIALSNKKSAGWIVGQESPSSERPLKYKNNNNTPFLSALMNDECINDFEILRSKQEIKTETQSFNLKVEKYKTDTKMNSKEILQSMMKDLVVNIITKEIITPLKGEKSNTMSREIADMLEKAITVKEIKPEPQSFNFKIDEYEIKATKMDITTDQLMKGMYIGEDGPELIQSDFRFTEISCLKTPPYDEHVKIVSERINRKNKNKEFIEDCIVMFEIENNRSYKSTVEDKKLLQEIIDSCLTDDQDKNIKAP